MKPTQQEIIELARESRLMRHIPFPSDSLMSGALERFAALLLERFGADGEEPDAYMAYNTKTGEKCPFLTDDPDLQHAKSFAYVKTQALYTRPSPDSLQAEYLRGLEDAAEWVEKQHTWITSAAASAGIRALKGKQ